MLFRPSESSKNIVDFYRRYLLTTFSTNKDVYNKQLKELLQKDKAIADGPYISMSDPYEKGKSLAQLADEGVVSSEILKIKNFHPQRTLYRHQEEAVRKANDGNNLIVTTGTGSGKTESFLIPVINQLLKEKEAGTLDPGVRTLIIYPMNALVNDQIRRLRELLSNMEGEPKITFGRFTGETKEKYKDAYAKYAEIEDLTQNPLSDNELISREQMRKTPPNILITNYAMLEYMLLRPGDNIIFGEENADKWKYIVFDEAHSYGGSKGIEVASLVKRVKAMIKREDIRFILTSATLGDENSNDEIIRFGTSLCGAKFTESSIVRSYVKKSEPTHRVEELNYDIYRNLATMIRHNASDEDILTRLKEYGVSEIDGSDLSESLFDMVLHDEFYYRVRNALDGQIKTVDTVAAEIGKSSNDFTDFIAVASNAMKNGERLFEAKYHMFLRGIEGVFVTLNPSNKLFINRRETYKPDPYDTNDIGYKVFEVSFCSNCNSLFITGQEKDGYLIQKSKFVDDYNPDVFLISGGFDEEELDSYSDNVFKLCSKCGAIKRKSSVNGLQCGHSEENFVDVVRVKKSGELLHRCPCCHSINGQRSILRPYFLGSEAATAVIATALYNELPSEIHHIEKTVVEDPFFGTITNEKDDVELLVKQFLAFSDNRQTAAFFATYLENTYRDTLVKRLMYQIMEDKRECGVDKLPLKSFARELSKSFELNSVFPTEKADELERKVWLSILKEMSNFKAKNSLLKKVNISFEVDFNLAQLNLPLTVEEINDLFKSLARHMMRELAIDTEISFSDAEISEIAAAGFAKGFDETSAGYSSVSGWCPEEGKTNKRLKYLTKILDGDESKARALLGSVWNYMVKNNIVNRVSLKNNKKAYKLNIDKIIVRNVDKLYRCTECKNITPYNIKGICENPMCNGALEVYDSETANKDDHYHKLYTELSNVPMSVHEHTAQLSSDTAYEYQKRFKDKEINVLSCSTTFEMGVDVGSLETVFMRNMPPSPANYAQRAGRAGRSLKSAAYAITYCPNNSHDLNYFKNPIAMIKGNIDPPHFNVSNDKIVLRHIFASAFSFFWKKHQDLYKDNIGEFIESNGFVTLQEYLDGKPVELKSYLMLVVPKDLIGYFDIQNFGWVKLMFNDSAEGKGICDIALKKYNSDISDLEQAKRERIEGNAGGVDYIIRSIKTIKEQKIIEFLSKNNLIPKYGFPVDTVELQGTATGFGANLRLSRDLFSAISEYAPDSEVVADGKLYTSRYVRRLSGYEWPTFNYAMCPDCLTLNRTQSVNSISVCKQCGKPLTGRGQQYLIPKFGFLMDSKGAKEVGINKPERTYKGSISYIGDENKIDFSEYDVCGKRILVGSSKMDSLAVLNESPFYICNACGYGKVDENSTDRVIKLEHKNSNGYKCGCDSLKRYALGHELQTDVAFIKFVDFDISKQEEAWTILYSMLEGLSRCMSIDRNELSGCLQWYHDIEHANGNYGFVLFDNTPGGAGYVRQLMCADVLAEMLRTGYQVVKSCECGGESADTACYSCLCNYYNQKQHDVLKRYYALDFYSQFSTDISTPWSATKKGQIIKKDTQDVVSEIHTTVQFLFCNEGQNQEAEPVSEIWENLLDDCDEADLDVVNKIIAECPKNISKPWYLESVKIVDTDEKITADLMWKDKKVMLFLSEGKDDYERSKSLGWNCYCTVDNMDIKEFLGKIEV